MSIQRQVRRVLSILGLALFAASPATAQVSEPEFVPYVNDLQMFDQPDLSLYGRGVAPPQGWFGSAEFINWSVQSPPKQAIGHGTPNTVFAPGGVTRDTGVVATVTVLSATNTPITATQIFASRVDQGQPVSGFVTQQNSLDTGFMQSDFTTGGRYEFGRVNDGRGWMVGTFYLGTQTELLNVTNVAMNFDNGPIGFLDMSGGVPGTTGLTDPSARGDGYDDDLDGDGIYGRQGRDRGTRNGPLVTAPLDGIPDPEQPGVPAVSVDYDDAVRLPTVFQSLHVENRVSTYSVELNRLWQLALGPRGGMWEFFVGPRFMNVRDVFQFDGRGSEFNPTYFLTSIADTYSSTTVDNNLLGAQIGSRWSLQRDRWQLSLESRFLAAANFQNVNQIGQFASRTMQVALPPGTTTTTNTNPLRDDIINGQTPHQFQSSSNEVTFAPTGEIRANLKYQVFRSVYLQMGYSAVYSYGVARASQSVYYSFPSMGIRGDNNKDDFFMNGVNFGVVVNR